MASLPTKAEASAYLAEQDLQAVLSAALNQVVVERAPNGIAYIANILQKVAHERENTLKMRELFASADTDGNGAVDISELRRFQERLGEPMTEEDLQAAFASMGGTSEQKVGFGAFSKWYETARQKGGTLSRKSDAYTRRAKRFSRVSHEESAGAFDVRQCRALPTGEPNTCVPRGSTSQLPQQCDVSASVMPGAALYL